MEINSTEPEPNSQSEQQLPWRKPEIERLVISLDTGNSKGSGPDFETHGPMIID